MRTTALPSVAGAMTNGSMARQESSRRSSGSRGPGLRFSRSTRATSGTTTTDRIVTADTPGEVSAWAAWEGARSRGRERRVPCSTTRTSSHTSRASRSPYGSAWAAAPSRSCGPPAMGSGSCSPSSADPRERFAASSRGCSTKALERFGQPPRPIGVHSPGHVAATHEQAREEFWPNWLRSPSVSETRGFRVPTEESFLAGSGAPRGAVRRIIGDGGTEDRRQPAPPRREPLRPQVQDRGLSHGALMTAIELYGTKVIPHVRELLAQAAELGDLAVQES